MCEPVLQKTESDSQPEGDASSEEGDNRNSVSELIWYLIKRHEEHQSDTRTIITQVANLQSVQSEKINQSISQLQDIKQQMSTAIGKADQECQEVVAFMAAMRENATRERQIMAQKVSELEDQNRMTVHMMKDWNGRLEESAHDARIGWSITIVFSLIIICLLSIVIFVVMMKKQERSKSRLSNPTGGENVLGVS